MNILNRGQKAPKIRCFCCSRCCSSLFKMRIHLEQKGLKNMCVKDVKEDLMRIREYERLIDRKLDEREHLTEMVTSITARWKTDVVQSSGSQDRFENAIAKIVDLEKEIDTCVDQFVDLKRSMMEKVNSLDSPLSDVLYLRYFAYDKEDGYNVKTWEEIAVKLNYSYRQITRFHGEGLKKICGLMSKDMDANIK